MKITKGDKSIDIPGWALLVGALVVDNLATNIIRLRALKIMSKGNEKEES